MSESTPLTTPKDLYKRGKSTSNSQKHQCKIRKNITNISLPKDKIFNYHQQRNDLLFDKITFDDIWINTDSLNYNLNNVKLKEKSRRKSLGRLAKKLSTSIIAYCEVNSGYVLRNDVAYDHDITMKQIEKIPINFIVTILLRI
ncbi:hypothetical protein [Clostridium gasigenes]|uniref:hypothetical protein n=1 Tax=Clostridium gasigenes TaxID=94869 RepID=UPI001C0ABA62|nr:hypothetical protein [Clostridium gasigenes]MBU3107723.1 hypothetical protein [Clostridium gasigenes]